MNPPSKEEPKIIFENGSFLILNKPSGLLVHPIEGKPDQPTLVSWLLENRPEVRSAGDDKELRPGIVHRLDKETSGIMLVAKTQESFEYFKKQFQDHLVKKNYAALVFGRPKKDIGRIDMPIGIKPKTIKRSVRSTKMAKEAITNYVFKNEFDFEGEKYALLDVIPETGRTHQIRVHLAHLRHPLVGDPLYGRKKQPIWAKRLMLHASSLSFMDPDGRQVVFTAELPEDFSENIRMLDNSNYPQNG